MQRFLIGASIFRTYQVVLEDIFKKTYRLNPRSQPLSYKPFPADSRSSQSVSNEPWGVVTQQFIHFQDLPDQRKFLTSKLRNQIMQIRRQLNQNWSIISQFHQFCGRIYCLTAEQLIKKSFKHRGHCAGDGDNSWSRYLSSTSSLYVWTSVCYSKLPIHCLFHLHFFLSIKLKLRETKINWNYAIIVLCIKGQTFNAIKPILLN